MDTSSPKTQNVISSVDQQNQRAENSNQQKLHPRRIITLIWFALSASLITFATIGLLFTLILIEIQKLPSPSDNSFILKTGAIAIGAAILVFLNTWTVSKNLLVKETKSSLLHYPAVYLASSLATLIAVGVLPNEQEYLINLVFYGELVAIFLTTPAWLNLYYRRHKLLQQAQSDRRASIQNTYYQKQISQ
ncbi:hypothetical protein BK816_04115 [Boudabousia tangfeifanii]|uniref:Uncharacterized protein n=1 Tax=Boudabousia tangfeifanii TaxID=1912795 RepID=A0A1D9MK72_9ACTO|nr:hypothetical protein [Boudabousia tangfeifanii]AOZ72579.1 hypothetical protein BK816_04115 [Boudabousia tangfeifanii]